MIQVVIVDDHPLARRGIAAILDEVGDIEVVLASGSPADVLKALEEGLDADVLLLDLYHADDEPCLAAIRELTTLMKVLVVSASARPSDVLGAVQAGASGYVTKLADPVMLVSAVRTVAAGGFALSAHLADMLQSELSGAKTSPAPVTRRGVPVAPLSPREEEALALIAEGFTHAQAATRMGVSVATVNTYVERIRAKLQVHNKAELTRAALRHFGDV
ncbi:LuxR C-terminal-related transcriptional regulator [Streptomyces gilvus]|uniref:LuxR C-terminal-related transcriptional regulator n=1 Tax=Streptomyces gilvus TaxID=2920937 RepID=UPI001F10D51B|nr:response regulator transcription factor [Streptomyces sp. CME 23]MCH5677887.1 response regulator transcription factor [Streptomyces sp. CME 23]